MSRNAPGGGYGNAICTVTAALRWRHVSENYNMLLPVADFARSEWVMMLNMNECASLAAAFTNYAVAVLMVSDIDMS